MSYQSKISDKNATAIKRTIIVNSLVVAIWTRKCPKYHSVSAFNTFKEQGHDITPFFKFFVSILSIMEASKVPRHNKHQRSNISSRRWDTNGKTGQDRD